MPTISVVIPCYGYAHFLPDAIHSLVGGPTCLGKMPGQTFADFEAVIVDDASHDDAPQVASELSKRYERVRYIRTTENLGTAGALNAGIRASVGKVISVLSADDMYEPWHLKQFAAVLETHPGSVVYGDIRAFADGQRLRVYKVPEYDFDNLLHKAGFGAAVMYERDSWDKAGGYPEVMRYGREDWAFAIALGQVGVCGVKSNGPPGCLYRRGDHNRTKRNKTVEWHERFKQQLRELFPHLYRGEMPVACCGGNSRNKPKRKNPKRNPAPLPGRDGMIVLEYTGRNVGAETFFTPEGNRYTFGGSTRRKTGYVDKKDVKYLLGLRDGRKKIFRRHKPNPKLNLTKKEIEQINPGTTKEPVVEMAAVKTQAVSATPTARRLADARDLNLSNIIGSGKDGRITVADIKKALKEP